MTAATPRSIRTVVLATAAVPVLALALLLGLPDAGPIWFMIQMLQQDVLLMMASLLIGAFALLPLARTWRTPVLDRRTMLLLALAVAALTYAGHYLVMEGYALVRDEQMVLFDAAIYGQGKLAWPLPPEWRSEAAALNLTFMLPVEQPVAWVSAYLPGNAALHALFGLLGDPALTGPVLSAVAMLALWSCARKIWPEDREVATVAVILLLVSGQFLFSGMSPWAMQAHLACNLVWLRLYLSGRARTDVAALAVGWLATGLHQPLFHPLFAGPFLLLLLRERRFGRFALYLFGYAAIGLFWLAWPRLTAELVTGPGSIAATSGVDYLSRLLLALTENSNNLGMMAANLVRFVAWQHLLLLPLLLLALRTLRGNGLAQAMLLGPLVTVVVMTLILPWQGYGFGYRYLHGQLGGMVLLAGFGWRWLVERAPGARAVLAKATVAALLITIPMQAWLVHRLYVPYAEADQLIAAAPVAYALIDGDAGYNADILLINRPDLSNRPLRLSADKVRDPAALARKICKPETRIAIGSDAFFRRIGRAYLLPPMARADAARDTLTAPYRQAGCAIVVLR